MQWIFKTKVAVVDDGIICRDTFKPWLKDKV